MTTTTKEVQIMAFLHEHVFGPILSSPKASARLKHGVRMTIVRKQQRDAAGMHLRLTFKQRDQRGGIAREPVVSFSPWAPALDHPPPPASRADSQAYL